jgi:hypothetical protein
LATSRHEAQSHQAGEHQRCRGRFRNGRDLGEVRHGHVVGIHLHGLHVHRVHVRQFREEVEDRRLRVDGEAQDLAALRDRECVVHEVVGFAVCLRLEGLAVEADILDLPEQVAVRDRAQIQHVAALREVDGEGLVAAATQVEHLVQRGVVARGAEALHRSGGCHRRGASHDGQTGQGTQGLVHVCLSVKVKG